MSDLRERISRGEILIMDGGVSTEIERKGVSMDAKVWSGVAHKTHPEVVRQVHEDYLRAGAEIITTNTFATARHVLESAGLGDDVASINRQAVQIAREARDNVAAGEVWIAGSMSSMPPLKKMRCTARGAGVANNYREQAEILAEAGVDLIVAEMMLDLVNAPMVMKAAVATGLPVWIGFSAALANGGESVIGWRTAAEYEDTPPDDFGDVVAAVIELGGEAAGIMHSQIAAIGPALDVLSKRWSGPKLAYAETGHFKNPDWEFVQIATPEQYATAVEGWVKRQGVQIVGGCCGTGPEHIRALRDRLH